jgi:hypothetical protein
MSNPTKQTNNDFNLNNNTPRNVAITVTANSHAVIRGGDNSLWDSTSNAYVTPEQTNAGTGAVCTGSSTKVNYPNQ